MTWEMNLTRALVKINAISNNRTLEFRRKLQDILLEVVHCVQAESGSLMLVKGRRGLEVAASTNPSLIGLRQSLNQESPSTWVVKEKIPLYVDDMTRSDRFPKRYDHYRKSAFVVVPIMSNQKVIGTLNVTNKVGEDVFTKEEQGVLMNVACQVISALEKERLTESLKKKKQELQKKNLELMKLERLKQDLFNMLIHDLKGPISEIVANLDVLSYTVTEENQETVELAKSGCDTLYRMVTNLLDIARLEEGKLQLVFERIEPQELVKEAVARLFGQFKLKELRFVEKRPPVESPGIFRGDRGMMLRVLQNLLTNAINYSPPSEIIEVGYDYPSPGEIGFFVKDNGPGIPSESREAIFDRFVQLEKKGDGRTYSTGLGLTFCKMAVEAHGGTIRAESGDPFGSRFSFTLPLSGRQ